MDLTQIATQLLSQKLGGSTQAESLAGPLSELLSGSSGGIDVGSLVAKFANQENIQDIVGSWLGDGENASLSSQQLSESLGQDKISAFASQLGLDEGQTTSALADVLPQLIDKSSSGGSLLSQAGGLGGLADVAKKFF